MKAHWRQVGVAAEARRCCPKIFDKESIGQCQFQVGNVDHFRLVFFQVIYVVQKLVNQAQTGNWTA